MYSDLATFFSYFFLVLAALAVATAASYFSLRLKRWSSLRGLTALEGNGPSHQYGASILAIGLGLVVVALWSGNQSCQHAQVAMADAVATASRSCDVLPANAQQRIHQMFIQFVEETRSLDASVTGAGPSNRFWQPLHQARVEARQQAQGLPDVWQIFIANQFDRLMETRHLWASSFAYQLQPVLWVVFALGFLFLLITMCVEHQADGIEPWTSLMAVAVPISLLLTACWLLSDPFQGICKVDMQPLLDLTPLLEQNDL